MESGRVIVGLAISRWKKRKGLKNCWGSVSILSTGMTFWAADMKVVSSCLARLSSIQTWGWTRPHQNVKWDKRPQYNAQEPLMRDDVSFPVAHMAFCTTLKHTLG